LTQEIDDKGATDCPIDGSIGMMKRSLIFTKHDIFDPMQRILNQPVRSNALGKMSGTGHPGTNKPATLMIGLSAPCADLIQADCSPHPNPRLVKLTGTIIDSHNPLNGAVAGSFFLLPGTFRGVFEPHQ